jgi:hypothetical protein
VAWELLPRARPFAVSVQTSRSCPHALHSCPWEVPSRMNGGEKPIPDESSDSPTEAPRTFSFLLRTVSARSVVPVIHTTHLTIDKSLWDEFRRLIPDGRVPSDRPHVHDYLGVFGYHESPNLTTLSALCGRSRGTYRVQSEHFFHHCTEIRETVGVTFFHPSVATNHLVQLGLGSFHFLRIAI